MLALKQAVAKQCKVYKLAYHRLALGVSGDGLVLSLSRFSHSFFKLVDLCLGLSLQAFAGGSLSSRVYSGII